jgi:hypothetical protein
MANQTIQTNGTLSIEFDKPQPYPQQTKDGRLVPGYIVPCFFCYGQEAQRISRLTMTIALLGNKIASAILVGDQLGGPSGQLVKSVNEIALPADFDDSEKQPAFDPEWQQQLIDVVVKPIVEQLS